MIQIRYRKKGENEDGEVSDESSKNLSFSRVKSPTSSIHSGSPMSRSQSDDTPSLSESDNDTKKVVKNETLNHSETVT